jgi:anti-anti-sigma factor
MVRQTPFKIERRPLTDSRCELLVSGELDLATTPRLNDEVCKAVADGAYTVEIDLANLTFIDSTGLRMFLELNEQASSRGWRLVLRNPSQPVSTILQITGSADEFPITQEEPER